MKLWRALFGIYQVIIAVMSILFIVTVILTAFSPGRIHWNNIFLVALIILPAIVFCFCNAAKVLLPNLNLFQKWKGLTRTSAIFTILWTVLFMYLLIFQTGSGSCQTSSGPTIELQTRQQAPDFDLKDQFGNMISLSNLRGKVILLDFWGVWCGPCRKKLPQTQKIYDQFKDRDVMVIGIHSAFRTEETAGFIAENNYTFPIGIDPDHIAKDYGVSGWPTYYLIDKQGRLAWGPKHAPPSEELIESLLKD